MKKLIVGLLMCLSLNAFASVDVNTNGLTDAQKAQLVQVAEQMKNTPVVDTIDKVDQWVNVGERMGKMMGGAAKEIGVAVNDFINTPVGMMTAALIVWNYMGSMIVHVVSGWALLIISFTTIIWISRFMRKVVIVYDETKGRNWRGRYPVKSITRPELDTVTIGWILASFFFATVLSLLVMFNGW